MNEKKAVFIRANMENAGIEVMNEDQQKTWLNTAIAGREEKIKKLKELDLQEGTIIEIEGSKNFWNAIKKSNSSPGKPLEKQYSNEGNKQPDWEGIKKENHNNISKLNAMNNSTSLITCLIENKIIEPGTIEGAIGLINTERNRIYKDLTGEDWK